MKSFVDLLHSVQAKLPYSLTAARMLWFFRGRRKEEECSLSFLENGGSLLEALISASNGRYDIPYRNFTEKEVIGATSNFRRPVMLDGTGYLFSGSYQQRTILVKRHRREEWLSYINRDIVVSIMMSHHKNVLKFMGCCFDFKTPVLLYEYDGRLKLLSDILRSDIVELSPKKASASLSWSNKLKIATDVGSALVYLHIAFSTPIIHTNLSARNIMVDQFGVAKLLDFSFCVSLPPGESQVQLDSIVGVTGLLDPEFALTAIVTEKTDVYLFGVLLLLLFTGMKLWEISDSNLLDKAFDRMEERTETMEQQLQSAMELALRCCEDKGEDRPNMIDVAKELSRIGRSGPSG